MALGQMLVRCLFTFAPQKLPKISFSFFEPVVKTKHLFPNCGRKFDNSLGHRSSQLRIGSFLRTEPGCCDLSRTPGNLRKLPAF